MAFQDLVYNPVVRLVYFAVLIVVVILILSYFKKMSGAEHLEGNQIYTAGASMRVLGSQFSSTNQGENEIVYNELAPGNIKKNAKI